jgi:hypothetical protein
MQLQNEHIGALGCGPHHLVTANARSGSAAFWDNYDRFSGASHNAASLTAVVHDEASRVTVNKLLADAYALGLADGKSASQRTICESLGI